MLIFTKAEEDIVSRIIQKCQVSSINKNVDYPQVHAKNHLPKIKKTTNPKFNRFLQPTNLLILL